MALAAAAIAPGEVREEGEWLAWCASGEPCIAELASRLGPPAIALSLRAGRGPRQPATLVVVPPARVARGERARLSIDGMVVGDLQAPGSGGGLALPLDARFGLMIRRGRALSLAGMDGTALGSVPLTGLSAALAVLTASRAVSAAPMLSLPPQSDQPPRTLSTKQAAKLIPSQPCGALPPGVSRAVRLDANTSLALVTATCADDYILQPLLVNNKGATRLADVDDAPELERADWDAAAHRLLLVEQRRPAARCAGERRYAWTGTKFALAERRFLCAGRAAPIVTYRAAVSAR